MLKTPAFRRCGQNAENAGQTEHFPISREIGEPGSTTGMNASNGRKTGDGRDVPTFGVCKWKLRTAHPEETNLAAPA